MPSVLKLLHARIGHRLVSILHNVQVMDVAALRTLDQPQGHKPPSGGASAASSQSHLWVPQHEVFHSAAGHPSPNGLHCSPIYNIDHRSLELWQQLVCSRASMHIPFAMHPLLCVATHLSGLLQATHAGLCLQGTAHLLHVVQPQLSRVAVPLVGGHYPLQLLQALHEGHRCRALLTHCPIQQRNHIPAEHTLPGVGSISTLPTAHRASN